MTLLIADQVDVLFRDVLSVPDGEVCENPITRGRFESGEDGIAYQKRHARKALWAREWFALYGPPAALPLPLAQCDWEDMRRSSGLNTLIGFYARSLSFRDWQVLKHPPFEDFACGLMAIPDTGFWDLQGRVGEDARVIKRYPPCPLAGMKPGAYWAPAEGYEEIKAEYRRACRAA